MLSYLKTEQEMSFHLLKSFLVFRSFLQFSMEFLVDLEMWKDYPRP